MSLGDLRFQSPAISFMSGSEIEKLKRRPAVEVFKIEAESISNWADCGFTTADGREFKLFVDGESIAHRLAASNVLGMHNPRERQDLDEIAGLILEVDAGQPPLIFKDHEELVDAWLGLHESFGVPLSDYECIALNIVEPEDEESEEA